MRTTIRLNDELLTEAKKVAAGAGKTLTAVIEDSLRETLGRRRRPSGLRRVRLPAFKGTGLRPGIDLDDSASLLDRMEEWDAAHRR
jgi:hypothetical protein